MAEKNIVVIGASYSGLLQSHSLLKHAIPQMNAQFPDSNFRVVLINPSPDFYFVVSAPRAIVSEKLVSDQKIFLKIADGFKQYAKNTYRLIQGTVIDLDKDKRTVLYTVGSEKTEKALGYHALVFASGGRTPCPLFTQWPSTDGTKEALQKFRASLSSARNIVIGGGGACAVEVAAEIAEHLNGPLGWFSTSIISPKASITVVTKGSKLLPTLDHIAAERAESYLKRLGVTVLYGKKILSTTPTDAGLTIKTLFVLQGEERFKVRLDDGSTLEADIYIPAFHCSPVTSYVPSDLLTQTNHIDVNPSTLRVDAAGSRVYALGECSSAFSGGSMVITLMTKVITTNLKRDLRAAEKGLHFLDAGKDREYERPSEMTQFVPVGRTRGVGYLQGWWLPSFVVWLLKGRDYDQATWFTNLYLKGGLVGREDKWPFEG